MYTQYWALIALTLSPVIILADILITIPYLIWNKSLKFYISFIILIIATLTIPFIISQRSLSFRDLASIYYFFALTIWLPVGISSRLSKNRAIYIAVLFVLNILGFIVYVTGGTISGLQPQ